MALFASQRRTARETGGAPSRRTPGSRPRGIEVVSKSEVRAGQVAWARSEGLAPDSRGYLASYEENLFQPLSPTAKTAFELGSGSELKDRTGSPAKMRALHSSSALAANAFDFWSCRPNTDLLAALGLPDTSDAMIRFEGQYPTGLPGNPPNLDVVLELSTGDVVGIESKFTEWLSPKAPGVTPFKEKYFPAGNGVWERRGLTKSQQFAEKLQGGELTFRYLDAPQLLKHALGLASAVGDRFRLLYIYFDCNCPSGEIHSSEIKAFDSAAGVELAFQALSYQDLLSRLDGSSAGTAEYRWYMRRRYLSADR